MITPEYCVEMARYNQWQNNGLRDLVKGMSEDDLRKDRGAFFNSISETLEHILIADKLWTNRLDPAFAAPEINDQPRPIAEWSDERHEMDVAILGWAEGLSVADLAGDVHWSSMIYGKDFVHSKALCLTHMFNHQTHHRGQVHAMMTATGQSPIDTDLVFMPQGDT